MAAARRTAANVAPSFDGPGWWRRYLELGGPRCAYCRRVVGYERLTRDHIVPRSRGGRTTPDNVLPACRSCNAKKRSARLRAFVATLRALDVDALPPHPLGRVEGGEWVWSPAARVLHAPLRTRSDGAPAGAG